MLWAAVLRHSHSSAAAGTMAGGTGETLSPHVRVKRMRVPWGGLFVERGAWGVAAVLKQLHWVGKLPGSGVQRPQCLVDPPALKSSMSSSPVPAVSFSELRLLLASGRARLFDVRSREEAAAGTIPGALNIPGIRFPLLAEAQSVMVLTKAVSFSTQWGQCR